MSKVFQGINYHVYLAILIIVFVLQESEDKCVPILENSWSLACKEFAVTTMIYYLEFRYLQHLINDGSIIAHGKW